jgi:peptidoglycan/LPS O-acetylase OafA/YrhL
VTSAAVAIPDVPARAAAASADEGPFHIPSLDGVRALSFMVVFVAHAGLERVVPGHFGLSMFFFLSGYLITTLLRIEFDRTGDISLKQFYLRRALRILPPFYLVLALAALLTAAGAWHGSVTLEGLAWQAAHLTNYYIVDHGWWHGLAPGTWVYWSLAIEEHFYLLFPLLYLVLRRSMTSRNRQALFMLGLCVLMLAWRCVLVFVLDAPKDRMYVATDTRVDSILAGCILAVWRNPALRDAGGDERRLKFVWIPLGLVMLVASVVVRKYAFDQTFRYTLQSFGLLPFFIAVVRWHDVGLFRLLNTRLARYIGVLSYSMYLLHVTTLWAFQQLTSWPTAVRGVAALAVCVILATVIHRAIERPCARLRRRLSRAFQPSVSAA